MILSSGYVINGVYEGWQIEIVDDTYSDTGGFYLVLRSENAQFFDYWFEKMEFLNNQLADYNVEWCS